ncbi:MAG: CPBP family intramembrane glutamic endopeptidase [archaeon]|nr:CPBP family intramembrane metalloprotease [archaeon]MDD2477619.1 CPBP family intramembrane metalloprotease [Candidatus ainarchaeum sp.]MDD3084286.1 CPBP family intramembrane metalloprotease [Candidatus ainarchaeum sp.]MDD4221027.1 CPBP family intramembrane metalloprotease [Candidatus ainarchaeum sp.]MDD4662499.1 CPBP family intramembrane metalloprotease [Candidatus ainarchaeum sp.]
MFFLNRKIKLKEIFYNFGLRKISFSNLVKHTLILFFLIFIISISLSTIFTFVGLDDLHLVSSTILSIPLLYIFYLFVIRVFLEEWFFRGFLVNRIGVYLSSLLFAIGHISYGSIVEVIGAFILGVVLGKYYLKTKNLWVNYLAHFLYNFSAFLLMTLAQTL